jgi:hypothetical protein
MEEREPKMIDKTTYNEMSPPHTLYWLLKTPPSSVKKPFTKMLNQYNCLTCFGPTEPSSEAHVLKGDCLHVHSELYQSLNPCGGGVEYLHRDPASRKRRWNGAKKGRAIA